MYMIEINEDKFDTLVEHVSKSIKCLDKVAECLEKLRSGEHDYEEDDYDERDRYAGGGRRPYYHDSHSRPARDGRYRNY